MFSGPEKSLENSLGEGKGGGWGDFIRVYFSHFTVALLNAWLVSSRILKDLFFAVFNWENESSEMGFNIYYREKSREGSADT